jgi:hypothetical protein
MLSKRVPDLPYQLVNPPAGLACLPADLGNSHLAQLPDEALKMIRKPRYDILDSDAGLDLGTVLRRCRCSWGRKPNSETDRRPQFRYC